MCLLATRQMVSVTGCDNSCVDQQCIPNSELGTTTCEGEGPNPNPLGSLVTGLISVAVVMGVCYGCYKRMCSRSSGSSGGSGSSGSSWFPSNSARTDNERTEVEIHTIRTEFVPSNAHHVIPNSGPNQGVSVPAW